MSLAPRPADDGQGPNLTPLVDVGLLLVVLLLLTLKGTTFADRMESRLPHAPIQASTRTPRPGGLTVPHGDVIAVLDAFLRAGIDDVVFEGSAPPMPPPLD